MNHQMHPYEGNAEDGRDNGFDHLLWEVEVQYHTQQWEVLEMDRVLIHHHHLLEITMDWDRPLNPFVH